NFPQLVSLLRDKLEWPIHDNYDFEDVVFEYEASELGLKKDEVAKIREIHQLRPLVTSQPWGVFFISLEDKALPVTVLRRILKALILNRRGQAKTADRQAWHLNDLIFAASFGKSGARELAFIHFSDGKATGDLPVMKVLGWNARDTVLKHEYVAATLRDKLAWPDDPENAEAWRAAWSSAFELRLNETIRTSKDLAVRLAELASDIRARVNQLLKAEDQTGAMTTMLAAFRKNLIHDLDADGFADMFAQTIAYGMLAARISRPAGIIADNLADMVPKTNPFLKELFGSFLKIGGRDKRRGLDFDELGVREVVDVLNEAKMDAVLRDFGDRNPKEDPVIHFYELFLKEYDPKKRMQRGVFYTPRPVVNFIVRGVDEILRTEFGLPLGLADISTWDEVAARNDRITIPAHVKPDAPFVQILDPATGTGTFLVEVIDLIHKRMEEHWKGQGKSAAEIKAAWNAYVPAHLLPRLTAFELMMAPYTIAHMKMGLKLSETGYAFGSEERARIFLTNALEPARDLDMEFIFMSEALAHEAQAANGAKDRNQYTVVVGNPPYSLRSGNMSPTARALVEKYKSVDGVRIQERGALQFEKNIQDDYVKFIATAENFLEASGVGVLSLVTNHSYIDNVTFPGLRFSLLSNFDHIRCLDLGGNVKKGSGLDNQNVFDIQQGVAVIQAIRSVSDPQSSMLMSGNLGGSREAKFERLLRVRMDSLLKVTPVRSPQFFFIDTGDDFEEYQTGKSISEIFQQYSAGMITARDDFAVSMDVATLEGRIERLASFLGPEGEIAKEFDLNKKGDWGISNTQRAARTYAPGQHLRQFLYRPFDQRYVFYHKDVVWGMANPTFQHVQPGLPNLVLVSTRKVEVGNFGHVSVFYGIVECHSISMKEVNYALPLFLRRDSGEPYRRPNIDRAWALDFGKALGLAYEDGIPRGEQKSFGPDFQRQKAEQLGLLDTPWDGCGDLQRTFGPRDLFDYIYAVLHSPNYRSRYAEFLKSDFPRIPAPATRTTFAALAALGRQLVGLHLLRPEDAPILKSPDIQFRGSGEARVAKGYPEYQNGKVMINASRWFEDVPKATWQFHVGGYQVCEKWLKDRAGKGGKNPGPGRVLTEDDILHYRRVVTALTETRRLMAEIDTEIDKHGGWPGAFKVDG
ncbi:MAG: hypothetical protein IOD05_18270, partial [Rhodobacter sp.]|nr:hypothetical protein [Rhodobacter sp.]